MAPLGGGARGACRRVYAATPGGCCRSLGHSRWQEADPRGQEDTLASASTALRMLLGRHTQAPRWLHSRLDHHAATAEAFRSSREIMDKAPERPAFTARDADYRTFRTAVVEYMEYYGFSGAACLSATASSFGLRTLREATSTTRKWGGSVVLADAARRQAVAALVRDATSFDDALRALDELYKWRNSSRAAAGRSRWRAPSRTCG